MSEARIAVIIPCHDDGPWLPEAVASIDEPEPVEVVVVDDGSRDPGTIEALERVEERGTTVVRHGQNRGVSAARMTGLAATRAPFVFPLDADDLAVPGRLSQMRERLEAEPAASACFGDYLEFDEPGGHLLLRGVPARLDPYRVAFTNEYPASAMFRRAVVEGLGGWRRACEAIDARSDWGLWMSLAEHDAVALHMGPRLVTYMRRIHPGRLAMTGRRHHAEIYAGLRARHPRLFAEVGEHRRRADMRLPRKLLYPVLYGRRAMRHWAWEPRVKAALDRAGVWTLRRPLTPAEEAELRAELAAIRARAANGPGTGGA